MSTVKRTDNPVPQLMFRKDAELAGPSGPVADPALASLTQNARFQDLFGTAPMTELALDFSKTPDVSFVSGVASQKLEQGTNLHDLLRWLACVGVDVGWKGTYDAPFLPAAGGQLSPVDFGNEPPSAKVRPYAEALQGLVAETKQLGLGVGDNGQPLSLRESAEKAAVISQRLIALTTEVKGLGPEGAQTYKAALQAVNNVSEVHNRIFYAMTDHVEAVKKDLGMETEASWPVVVSKDSGDKELRFRNTFRVQERLSAPEREQMLAKAYEKLYAKGGSEADIVEFTGDVLKDLKSGELFEFAARGDSGEIKVSKHPEVKHSHLAGLEDADTAGGSRFWLDASGDVALVMLCAKSGHFRPTEDSLKFMADRFVELGVPRERIVTCAGDFSDPSVLLALDIWNHKAENGGEMSKEQGNALFAEYDAFTKATEADAQKWVASLKTDARAEAV